MNAPISTRQRCIALFIATPLSVTPLLRSATAEPPRPNIVINFPTYPQQYAIRHGDWLLIDADNGYRSCGSRKWEERRDYPKDDGSDHELYNLAQDPGQRDNLAAEHPEIVTRLRRLLEQTRTL